MIKTFSKKFINELMLRRNDLITVKARICFKPAGDGGRIYGVSSGYRPNHVFRPAESTEQLRTYVGEIQFTETEVIQPGETKIVTIQFLLHGEAEKFMNIGQKWLMYEELRLVADGEVIEVI